MTTSSPIKVVGIISLAFSGSTVLNYVLGSHPGVYGASEIYALAAGEQWLSKKCSWCEGECPVLSKENVNRLSKQRFYRDLSSFSGKKNIVDSSKHYWWFDEVFNAQPSTDFEPYLILLTKHPLRHLASFMNNHPNHLFRSGVRSVLKRVLVSPQSVLSSEKMHLDYWLDVLIDYYGGMLEKPLFQRYAHQSIKYEDFVLNTESTLAPTLKFMNTTYNPDSVRYETYEHHGIGGNSGVLRKILSQEQWNECCDGRPEYRRDYYRNCEGLKLDNRYSETFSEKTVLWLESLSKYQTLCRDLGYDLLP